MIAQWRAEICVPAVSHHAEGPLWDQRSGRLLWVDQYVGLIRSATFASHAPLPGGPVLDDPVDVGGPVGAVVPAAQSGWTVAARDGFLSLSESGRLDPVVTVLPDDGVRRRMNDGKVDPAGRFWAGSMAFDKREGAGSLYALAHGRARTALTGITISNGLAWTPDGAEMFYIDTPTQRVVRLEADADDLVTRGSVVVEIPPEQGHPDGMCMDDEGALWVALWGGSAVERYSPSGEPLGRVTVDAPQVSSCAFGGPDRGTLFITTSREDYTEADVRAHPTAGAIFAVRPGVTGPAALSYQS
ncbi:SMP-30/gluconolactonase/LRE family protein [Streptomyces sp. 6N223]|uniref:SMP-30/gluconolactonase/LRE family protein n=1 Tax=Streptomyces sp. 6N223 TaxID=3457412 RepID=UPI003FD48D1D